MTKEKINELLEELKEGREKQIRELELSGNSDDWIKATALKNVKFGIENARQYLMSND